MNGKRYGMRVGLVLMSSALLVAMGTGLTAAKTTGPALHIPKLRWKGTITMYAQAYSPVAPGVKLKKGAIRLTAFGALAKQFEHLYPGIKISFVEPFNDTNQSVETKAAGGTMLDVYWNQYGSWNAVFPPGIVYNLDPYFNQPNPYIPGNKKWKDVMSARVLQQTVNPTNGAHYELDADWVGTAFYYNKRLFAKAGITAPPKTWTQLITDAKRLTAHHIIAGADIPMYYGWWARLFLGNDLGLKTLTQLEKWSKARYAVTALGEVIGYKKGVLNPATNPRIIGWWPLVKQLYHYFDPNVTDIPWNNVPAGAQTGSALFGAGKVAMVYQGSWLPNEIKAAGAKFPLGSFPFPTASLHSVYKFATNVNSAADVGGPSAAYQFGISTPRADQSMRQPGKFQAVLDWLRFIGTPQHVQAVVNQLGEFVPTLKGTKPVPSEAGAALPKGAQYASIQGFDDVTNQAATEIGNVWQEYLGGHLSFAAAKQQYDAAVRQAVQQYIATNHPHIP